MVHRVPGPIDVRKVQSSPSALQFVSSTAISAAATVVVTGLEVGFDYIIQLEAFAPATDGQSLWMRWSDDAGVSYEAGASDYSWGGNMNGIATNDPSDSEIALSGTSTVGNDATSFSSFKIDMINPNASDEQTTTIWQGFIMDTQATQEVIMFNGGGRFLQGTDAVDAVQFLWSGGGNFKAQGDVTVWKRKRS